MINGNTNDFVDNLYYGTEMYFIYNKRKYFIQGWVNDDLHYLVLDYDYEAERYDHQGPKCNQPIWEYSSEDAMECVKAFLEARLWDGKTFFDVEKEIIWSD